MYLIPVLLFSFSANIDSFIIGISYGVKKTEIRPAQNLLIALITLCGTVAALLSGTGILTVCPFPGSDFLGNLLLLALGVYYMLKFFLPYFKICAMKKHSQQKRESPDHSKQVTICDAPSSADPSEETSLSSNYNPALPSLLSWKEALILSVSLSVNNLGIGIGASIAGLKVLPTAPVSFVLSLLFLHLGNLAGRSRIFEKAGQYADLFCGLLLLILGFCQ